MTAPTTQPAEHATSHGADRSTDRSTDRIEEQVHLPHPPARVWRSLTDPAELGAWFGADLTGATIAPGAQVQGHFTAPGHEHLMFDVTIESMEADRRFAWRWHPNATDTTVDLAAEPRTLVTFILDDAPDGGTLLRVVESGFDAIGAARRSAALLGNSKGWASQLHKRLPAYLAAVTGAGRALSRLHLDAHAGRRRHDLVGRPLRPRRRSAMARAWRRRLESRIGVQLGVELGVEHGTVDCCVSRGVTHAIPNAHGCRQAD